MSGIDRGRLDRRNGITGALQRVGEERGGDVVPAGRQRDLDGALGTAIELRRAARTGAGPPGPPPVRRLEQSAIHESIEMEGGEGSADACLRRDGVAIERLLRSGHCAIDAPPNAVCEEGQRVDGFWGRVSFAHPDRSKPSCAGAPGLTAASRGAKDNRA